MKKPPGDPKAFERFQSLLTRLVRVPKREIDAEEKKYKQEREAERTTPKRKRA